MRLQTLIVSRVLFIIVAIIALVLLSSVSPAPPKSVQASPKFDTKTEQITSGVVEDIQLFQCALSGGLSTHLRLRTESGFLTVHLAPRQFIDTHGFVVAKGDRVKLRGWKAGYPDSDTLIAREITRGKQTLLCRRPDGTPLWNK